MLIGSCNERGKYVDYFKIFKTDSDELRPYIPDNKDSIEDSMLEQVTVGTVTTPIKPYEFLQEYQAGYESFKTKVNEIYKELILKIENRKKRSSPKIDELDGGGDDDNEEKINQARIRCLNEARKVLRDENLYIDYMLHIYNTCTKARKELETGLAQEETDFMQKKTIKQRLLSLTRRMVQQKILQKTKKEHLLHLLIKLKRLLEPVLRLNIQNLKRV